MTACGYLWGVPAPTRLAPVAVPAVVEWCRSRRLRRPMLVGGRSLTATPHGLGIVHGLEAEGLAVWAFDRAASPSLVAVADAVAGYSFENCDCVIAIGGGVAMEVARAAALMTAQRSPYRELAAEPGAEGKPVDASGIPALLAVPATPAAALAVGAAAWIADDAGIARPIRHPALRPGEAILAADLIAAVPSAVGERSAALAALIAADAGVPDPELAGLLADAAAAADPMRAALGLAAAVEGAGGPRRRIALTAAVASGADFAATMAALAAPASWLDGVRARLGPPPGDAPPPDARMVRAARSACGPEDAADLDGVAAAAGLDGTDAPRRRGRQGRVA
ncbi:iron-containing alcohol dehydrogenase [Thalassobaculum sp.]|uniref:iron-containing alcohol dehydrogenase n=3 Tax=Thalassobaculum sp. TaxID=2022740 RepID=UPI0032F02F14